MAGLLQTPYTRKKRLSTADKKGYHKILAQLQPVRALLEGTAEEVE
jgi:hypothetical protein